MRSIPLEPFDRSLAESAAVLRGGGLVVFRTDTLYGVSAWPGSSEGMERLRALKSAPASRPFLSLAASPDTVFDWSAHVPDAVRELAAQVWPGPVTLVLGAGAALNPALAAPDGSWAVRVPDLEWARSLALAAGGALPSSSANRPGHPPCRNAPEALAALDGLADLVVDAGEVSAETPASALLDARAWPPRLLRGSHPRLAAFGPAPAPHRGGGVA